MIKVILATAEGQKTDLFPESFSIRDVFREFHEDYVGKAVLVDEESIPYEKLWSSMREYCQGSIMRITVNINDIARSSGFDIDDDGHWIPRPDW